jgi:hypothetical protein
MFFSLHKHCDGELIFSPLQLYEHHARTPVRVVEVRFREKRGNTVHSFV